MNPAPDKLDYLLLFRGTDWYRDLSPDEIQTSMTDWMKWFNRLIDEGRCKGGQSLDRVGKVVTGKLRQVSDGPFAEAKEMVAGYFILTVASEDEAVEIAKECPTLPFGVSVEVRPLLARCRASELATGVTAQA